jgi:hypothetical protein
MRWSWILAIAAAGVVCGQLNAQTAAEGRTRFFSKQTIQYTLPGPDWTWLENEYPAVICKATNGTGLEFNITYKPSPGLPAVDHNYVREFERAFLSPGELDKRSSNFITFRDRNCYQLEGRLANGRTTVTRILFGNGFAFHLTLIGQKEPIEKTPVFNEVMDGFEILTPPNANRDALILWGTRLAALGLGIGALYLLVRFRRRRAPVSDGPA